MDVAALPVALTAIPIGIAFGVLLERTGLGNPRVIAAQLTGRDFTVVRMMFGAIVTAMLGLAWFSRAGWVSLADIAIPPTDVAGQILGAVIFGGGFALAALCPGTACVAAASGRRDGIVTAVGMLVGTALTALLWPVIGVGVADTVREGATIDADLGVTRGVVVFGVTLMAVAAFAIIRRFESAHHDGWWKPRSLELVALSFAAAYAMTDVQGGIPRDRLSAIAAEIERESDHVDALELAEWIREGRTDLRIIDVSEYVDSGDYMIPGASWTPLAQLPNVDIESGETVVLYSEGGAHAAQGWVLLRARGAARVFVLKDGLAAWEDEVMRPLVPAATADDTTKSRFARARELSLWFGGRPTIGEPGASTSAGASRAVTRARRRNTC